jgi:hypothetical protein
MRALLHYYRVELHNFNPNSIAQAAIFTAVYEGYLGIEPHWDMWIHLFHTKPFSLPSEVRRVCHIVRVDGCTLQLRSDRAQLYIPATITSSNKGGRVGGSTSITTMSGCQRSRTTSSLERKSGGAMEVGAVSGALDLPEVTAGGAAKALGSRSHRCRS